MEIIQAYRNRGGLSQFILDVANGQLPEAVRRQYLETLRCIGATSAIAGSAAQRTRLPHVQPACQPGYGWPDPAPQVGGK